MKKLNIELEKAPASATPTDKKELAIAFLAVVVGTVVITVAKIAVMVLAATLGRSKRPDEVRVAAAIREVDGDTAKAADLRTAAQVWEDLEESDARLATRTERELRKKRLEQVLRLVTTPDDPAANATYKRAVDELREVL